jgi:hypothetical protein
MVGQPSVVRGFGNSDFRNAFKLRGSIMPECQQGFSLQVSAIERPNCPRSRWNRMLPLKREAGPSGVRYRTFECQKCGCVHRAVTPIDPMNSIMLGWLAGELKPPT